MVRADAQRNREAIVDAARSLFVEKGVDVALDAVAQRAGVSIATLYRNFPDRRALLREVALGGMRSLRQAALEARGRIAAESEAAWIDFAVAAADLRAGVLMPVMVTTISGFDADAELDAARTAAIDAVDDLVTAAQQRGQLRRDVSSVDVMALMFAVVRPLPMVPPPLVAEFTQRAIRIMVAGLRPDSDNPLPGTPLPTQTAGSVD